jgi:RsiW-degrading membrane proteinase PrsW (M82 family)
MVALAFFMGMIAVLPFFALGWQWQSSPNLQSLWNTFSSHFLYLPSIIVVFFFAFLEESLKQFAVLRLGSKLKIHFDQIVDGIVYAVSAGLGFAFAENIFYFFTLLDFYTLTDPALWNVVAFRSFGTTLGHSLFSGVFGLFWGHAFLSKKVANKHSYSVSCFFIRFFETLRFHIIFVHILKAHPSLKGHESADLVREALLLSVLLHAVFNLFLQTEVFGIHLTPFVAPLLLLIFLFLSSRFLIPRNTKIMKPVS